LAGIAVVLPSDVITSLVLLAAQWPALNRNGAA